MLRQVYEEALARREHDYGPNDSRTVDAARNLGQFLLGKDDSAARRAFTRVVEADEATYGKDSPQTLADVGQLASAVPRAEAAPLLQRVAQSPDPNLSGWALSATAELYAAAGNREMAAKFWKQALSKAEVVNGKDGPVAAGLLNALALAVEPKEGIPYLLHSLEIYRRGLGEAHPQIATTKTNLCKLLTATGHADEAIAYGNEALQAFRTGLGDLHSRTAIAATELANAYAAKPDRPQAERLFRLALSINETIYGAQNPQTKESARLLAEFLRNTPPKAALSR